MIPHACMCFILISQCLCFYEITLHSRFPCLLLDVKKFLVNETLVMLLFQNSYVQNKDKLHIFGTFLDSLAIATFIYYYFAIFFDYCETVFKVELPPEYILIRISE